MKFCDVADAIEETGACNDKVDFKASRLYLENQLEKVTKYFDPKEARIIKEKASVLDEYDLITENRIIVDKTLSTLDEKEQEMIEKNKIVETVARFNKELTEILQKLPKPKAKQPHDQPQRHFEGIGAFSKEKPVFDAKQSKIPKSPTRRQPDSIDRQLNNEHRRQGRSQFQQNTNPNYEPQNQTRTRSSEFRGAQHINPKFELHGQTLSPKESPRPYDKRPFYITQGVARSLDNLSKYQDTHLNDGPNRQAENMKMLEEVQEKDQETKRRNRRKIIPIGEANNSDMSYSPDPCDSTEMRRSEFGKQQWTSHH